MYKLLPLLIIALATAPGGRSSASEPAPEKGALEGLLEGLFDGEIPGDGEAVNEGIAEAEAPEGQVTEGATEGEGPADGEGLGGGEGVVDGEGDDDGEGDLDGEGVADGEGAVEGEGAGPRPVIYVSASSQAQELEDGLSWATAYDTIGEGVAAASAVAPAEVWVGRGSYTPSGSLALAADVALYGGFAGNESLLDQRELDKNPTAINASTANEGGPAAHAVVGADGAALDGFIVAGGNGDGGGLLAQGVEMEVRNCVFLRNSAPKFGAGLLAVQGAVVTVEDCVFRENDAAISGGGLAAFNSTVHSSGNLFYRNVSAGEGGGAYFGIGTTVTSVGDRFTENTANAGGGLSVVDSLGLTMRGGWVGRNSAVALGGGMRVSESANVLVTNSVFSLNTSDTHGGGANNEECSPFYSACTFSGNSAGARGEAIYNTGVSNTRLLNCIVANSPGEVITNLDVAGGPVGYSLVEGVTTVGTGNTSGDPRFIDETHEVYGLQSSSPAVDTGKSTAAEVDGGETTDFSGGARGVDGDGFGAISGDGSEYDMGAFELPSTGAMSDAREVPRLVHSGDTDGDFVFDLGEVLRVIQLYNAEGFGCSEGTEDGYAPTAEETDCEPHSSDYEDGDFRISLSELLRAVQIFNLGGYFACAEQTPDGVCVAAA